MKKLILFVSLFALVYSCSTPKEEKYNFFGNEVIYHPNANKLSWCLKEFFPTGEIIEYYFEDGRNSQLIDGKFSEELENKIPNLRSTEALLKELEKRVEWMNQCIDTAKVLGVTKLERPVNRNY